ncbi:MAG: aminotransferase class I/II-fold pyridoxal phosphate-dependent enzyme [Rhizobiaceae bacterium]
MKNELYPATVAAQAGGAMDPATGGLVPPIQPSTTYARDRNYQLLNADFIYGRDDSDTVRKAEAVITRLEKGEASLLFPSGMAATAALMRTIPSGASLVIQSGIYWGTTKWVREFCARRSINLVAVDATDSDALADIVRRNRPHIVWLETPSNPWLGTVDILKASQVCRETGSLLAVDGTAATPVLSQPLTLGADISMHSATKAINGHSDVLAGVLTTSNAASRTWQEIRTDRHDAGAIIGNFEAWLLLRGMRTLPLRVERMSSNALAIARWLEAHDKVERVFYPGLDSHPGHALAARQMQGGYGGLMSFLIRGSGQDALDFCGALDLFHRATSLGGVESLVEHRHTIEGDATGIPPSLVRLSIGIEHVDDLIADLDQAFAAV